MPKSKKTLVRKSGKWGQIRRWLLVGAALLLFFMLFVYEYFAIERINLKMQRGDILFEQRRIEAEIRKLEREAMRLTHARTLEVKARLLRFHPPSRTEMVRIRVQKADAGIDD